MRYSAQVKSFTSSGLLSSFCHIIAGKWFVLFWMCDLVTLARCCKLVSFFIYIILFVVAVADIVACRFCDVIWWSTWIVSWSCRLYHHWRMSRSCFYHINFSRCVRIHSVPMYGNSNVGNLVGYCKYAKSIEKLTLYEWRLRRFSIIVWQTRKLSRFMANST